MDKKQKDNAGFLSLFRRRKKTAGMVQCVVRLQELICGSIFSNNNNNNDNLLFVGRSRERASFSGSQSECPGSLLL